jgi:hypothetical protein
MVNNAVGCCVSLDILAVAGTDLLVPSEIASFWHFDVTAPRPMQNPAAWFGFIQIMTQNLIGGAPLLELYSSFWVRSAVQNDNVR